MAGSILTAPSTTLSTNTEWQNELGYTEAARYGYEGISLTEWASGNTNKPQIAAGSTIEIDGAMAEYASDTALTDDASLTDGWCYIKHVVSGTVVTPTLTNTFGTWDTAKQGYYDGSGNRYSLFAMYRSGAVTKIYTGKNILDFSLFGLKCVMVNYTGNCNASGSAFFTPTETGTFLNCFGSALFSGVTLDGVTHFTYNTSTGIFVANFTNTTGYEPYDIWAMISI